MSLATLVAVGLAILVSMLACKCSYANSSDVNLSIFAFAVLRHKCYASKTIFGTFVKLHTEM